MAIGKRKSPAYNFQDLSGLRFGRWTVVSFTGKTGPTYWNCRCDCGTERKVAAGNLKKGLTTSCGCWKDEKTSDRAATHRRSNCPEYRSWYAMRQRCGNPRNVAYANYGGRGITVCERWQHSFQAFLSDMGDKPTPAHSLDRVDNDGNYEPGNVVWASKHRQSRNKRTNRMLTFNGKTQTLEDWANELGLCHATIHRRLKDGWDLHDAFQPAHMLRRK